MSGATPNTTETAASSSRAFRPSNRSRMIARGRMPSPPAAAPCTRRKASSTRIEGARAAPAEVRVNRTRAAPMTALRPKRSASGPTRIGALEKPAMKMAIAAAASVCGARRSASISGRPGSAMSIASGGRAVSTPRNSVSPTPRMAKRVIRAVEPPRARPVAISAEGTPPPEDGARAFLTVTRAFFRRPPAGRRPLRRMSAPRAA